MDYLFRETNKMTYPTNVDPRCPYTSMMISRIHGLPEEAEEMQRYCKEDTLNTFNYMRFVANKEAIVYLTQKKYKLPYDEADKRCRETEFNFRAAFKSSLKQQKR
ncbi:uncharacterized protein LOC117121411 [Anneissia japonica]|uniref:uncharacterized protein LOC117121411 n=1 Tax=Anneissia japonica TaxID=1529436 RepID=UPI001425B47C|nr:uncharacterized protein LOC117121411 [Anneissia japonica]